jgi:hypothetical protein
MDKFEEYKFFAEDTQKLSERRQNTSQTYVTVNAAIFAVLALLIKDVGFRGWTLVLTALPLFSTGVLLCFIWQKIIIQHKLLIGWRYDQLKEMEKVIAGSFQMYIKEWEDFFKPRQGKERFSFSLLDIWMPRLFLILYLIYGIGLVIAAAANYI